MAAVKKERLLSDSEDTARTNYGYTESVYSVSYSGSSVAPEGGLENSLAYDDGDELSPPLRASRRISLDDDDDAGYKMLPVDTKSNDSEHNVYYQSISEPKVKKLEEEHGRSASLNVSSGSNAIMNAYKERDWNKEFQSIMAESQFLFAESGEISASDMDKYGALSHLARDFIYASKLYAKVIISELFVPTEHKTIKPVKIGGIAGGDKYICGGILFKFALDTRGLYGGDEYAMKAASHELKGLQCLYQSGMSLGLNFPLMSVIDYRGYRVVAMSLLPISKDTIIYGSADAGKTVHASDPAFNERMAQAAHMLNLKGHKAGLSQTTVFGPADIEGHKSKADGKYYLVDYARLMPPQVRLDKDKTGKQTHLYQLLRPELVQSNSTPLSSDALTGLGRNDPMRKQHNAEVIEASRRIFEVIIPNFARTLEKDRANDLRASKQLCDVLHSAGINIRHLGLIFSIVKPRFAIVRKALLTEMVARIMKDDIKAQLRVTMQRVRVPSEEPYSLQLLQYLNSVFVSNVGDYWDVEVPCLLQEKFAVPEDDPIFAAPMSFRTASSTNVTATPKPISLLEQVDKQDLLMRFQQLSGVKLTKGAMELLQLGTSELTGRDVALRVVVKNMNIVEHSAACSLAAQALQRDGAEAQRLFAQAVESFASAMSTSPLSSSTLYQWGSALHRLSQKLDHMASGRDSVLVLREALLKLEQSTQINRIFHPARVEACSALIDTIIHPGRLMIPEQQRHQDTQQLFESAAEHMSNAMKLEQLAQDNVSIEQSISRLKQMIKQMDEFRLVVVVHVLFRVTEIKAPHPQLQRRVSSNAATSGSSSSIKEAAPSHASPTLGRSKQRTFEQIHQSYFNLVASRIATFAEVEIPDCFLFDVKTMRFFLENLSPKRIRSVVLNRTSFLTNDILEIPIPGLSSAAGNSATAASSSVSSISTSSRHSHLERSSSLNEKTASIELSQPLVVPSGGGRALLERARSGSKPMQPSASATTLRSSEGTSLHLPLGDEIHSAGASPQNSTIHALISPRASSSSEIVSRSRTSLQLGGLLSSREKSSSSSQPSTPTAPLVAGPPAVLAKIRTLNLIRCSGITVIPAQFTKLKTLILSCTEFADEHVRSVITTLPQLTSIDLSGCTRLTPRVFEYLNSTKKLKTLLISREVSTKLSTNTHAIHIEDPIITIASLQTLDLSGVQSCGRAPLQKIADSCPSLTHLDLHNVKNVNDVAVLPILRKCRDLATLDLASTQITNATVRAIGQHLTALKKLLLGQNTGLVDDCGIEPVLRTNPQLEEIDFSSCFKISDATFAFLGVDGTPAFPSLKTLSLYLDSLITDQSVNFIVKQFPSLQSLNLTSLNKISNLSLIAISKHAVNLRKLSVHYCLLLSDDGLIPVARNCTNLTSLSIAQCRQITDKAILELAKNVTSLTMLDISKSEQISPFAVQQLLQRNRGMEALIAIECKELSGDFLFQKCRHSCPKLDILVERTKKVTPCLWDPPHEVHFNGNAKN